MTQELRSELKKYFKTEFADLILKKLQTGHKLSSFKVNPLILTALSSGVLGSPTSLNMAKALLYPRVFGTSTNTSFGDKMQTMCIKYLDAEASSTPGMDIEFEDKIDSKRIIMQLKAGPNTINSEDVEPILRHMNSAYRLLQQNRVKVMPTFAIGITYGTINEISGHYKKIQNSPVGGQMSIPIFIGQDFWARLTGDKNFYNEMISVFIELFEQEDYSSLLDKDLENLSKGIEEKYFTNGVFDVNKI